MPEREPVTDVPRIACVGRTNEGKTSVVAALTENDQLAIADAPGTTRRTQPITCRADEGLGTGLMLAAATFVVQASLLGLGIWNPENPLRETPERFRQRSHSP